MSLENPLKREIAATPPMHVIRRFTKPGGHWAEIRERTATPADAVELLVFVDGSLVVSQIFHNERKPEYPEELDARIKQFLDEGWIEERRMEERRIEERRIEERRAVPRLS